jgi:hypothetical protein
MARRMSTTAISPPRELLETTLEQLSISKFTHDNVVNHSIARNEPHTVGQSCEYTPRYHIPTPPAKLVSDVTLIVHQAPTAPLFVCSGYLATLRVLPDMHGSFVNPCHLTSAALPNLASLAMIGTPQSTS